MDPAYNSDCRMSSNAAVRVKYVQDPLLVTREAVSKNVISRSVPTSTASDLRTALKADEVYLVPQDTQQDIILVEQDAHAQLIRAGNVTLIALRHTGGYEARCVSPTGV